MSIEQVIRAWKDAEYRQSLSEAERALLPANPAGAIELDDADLDAVAGAARPGTMFCTMSTAVCPGTYGCASCACK
jgi:mersacidin/lichenicidin family type 2 lantibiotic